MKYALFLDDERTPGEAFYGIATKHNLPIVIVRNFYQATAIMLNFDCPFFASFDHDLGAPQTGYDVAKWMVLKNEEESGNWIPDDFQYWVHSQNPVGARQIKDTLDSILSEK